MTAPIPFTRLPLPFDVDLDRRSRNHRDFPADPQHPGRITPFVRRLVGRMEPVMGMATDPQLLSALAKSGTGWVNRDGRVIAKGSTWDNEALLALPETAALVAAQLRLGQERAYEYDDPDDRTEEAIAAVEPDMMDLHDPIFHERLHAAGWMRVDLSRDRDVKMIGTQILGFLLDDYRPHLTAIADALGCRVLSGAVGGENRLLYDSVETAELPFSPGFVGYREGPAGPPTPRWGRVAVDEPEEDYGDTVGFGR